MSREARGDEKCNTSDTSAACDVIANNLKRLILRISDLLHKAREKRKTPPVVACDNHGTYTRLLADHSQQPHVPSSGPDAASLAQECALKQAKQTLASQ